LWNTFALYCTFSTFGTHTLYLSCLATNDHTQSHISTTNSGFEWRTRKYDLVSWEENFQNLVKFGSENQHYNVPSPIDAKESGSAITPEQEEANRFYKWVKRTRAEYKSLMGGKSSRMLTEERVAKLRQIGFIV
jgi:hypothetical protein